MTATALALLLAAPAGPSPVQQAERLAASALAACAGGAATGLADARKALALTTDFEPTTFVAAGRKGEVVEDAFEAARHQYRIHRSRLYEAVGACLAGSGKPVEAVRYLGRAVELERRSDAVAALARALAAAGRPREALAALLPPGVGELSPAALQAGEQAASALGLPSLQAEIDAARLKGLPPELHVTVLGEPPRFPERTRLSTGAPFTLDPTTLTLFYVADAPCKACSADLEALKRALPRGARALMVPAVPDRDEALRKLLVLYRYDWPVMLGTNLAGVLGGVAPSLVALARGGWSGARVAAPFGESLPGVFDVLARRDVTEEVPRINWNRRPPDRTPLPPPPGLRSEGFAPGEDAPAPQDFEKAVAAYAGGQPAAALPLLESLEKAGDGWLLPPEARFDRALCLAALGRRDEARRLLLAVGDSRFQPAVDRALESVGAKPGASG